MLYKIGNWINESSGQILDSIKSQYMNISTYRSLIGSSFVKLPAELKSPKKDLSTSKKKKIQKELHKKIKSFLIISITAKLNFLYQKKILSKLKQKITFPSILFIMKIN